MNHLQVYKKFYISKQVTLVEPRLILCASATFDFPDVKDEEDGLSSDTLSSRIFLKAGEVVTATSVSFKGSWRWVYLKWVDQVPGRRRYLASGRSSINGPIFLSPVLRLCHNGFNGRLPSRTSDKTDDFHLRWQSRAWHLTNKLVAASTLPP